MKSVRAYWNNSNEYITYKLWTLSADRVTQNNVTSIVSKGIEARLVQDEPQVLEFGGQQYRYSGHAGRVEFLTNCEEQELMLKLMYGKDLMLITVNTVAPQSRVCVDV